MSERQREKREPYLFPPNEHERYLQDVRDEREARRRRYYASRRKEVKDGKATSYVPKGL